MKAGGCSASYFVGLRVIQYLCKFVVTPSNRSALFKQRSSFGVVAAGFVDYKFLTEITNKKPESEFANDNIQYQEVCRVFYNASYNCQLLSFSSCIGNLFTFFAPTRNIDTSQILKITEQIQQTPLSPLSMFLQVAFEIAFIKYIELALYDHPDIPYTFNHYQKLAVNMARYE